MEVTVQKKYFFVIKIDGTAANATAIKNELVSFSQTPNVSLTFAAISNRHITLSIQADETEYLDFLFRFKPVSETLLN